MSSSTRLPASHLYLFQLPPGLVNTLTPRQLVIPPDHPLHPSNRTAEPAPPTHDLPPGLDDGNRGAYTCALTGASFDTLEGLKQHYRTDWYRYNVKLKLQGKPTPVSEQAFHQLVEDLSDSLSGSDSSLSDSDSSTSSLSSPSSSRHPPSSTDPSLSRLLAKQSLSSPSTSHNTAFDSDESLLAGPKSPLQWFDAPATEGGVETQYGIHRAALPEAGARKRLLPSKEEGEAVLAELRALQLPQTPEAEGEGEKTWTMLMFGGGHFAGWVISLRPKLVSGAKGGKGKEREVVVIESKTFHRYTTRRKQGGGQGANDAANGKAKSAGAQIRRHNEAMLNDEVGALLTSWSSHIQSSSLIFLRASKSSYKTFFFPSSPLVRTDPRIRGFGFPTKRPTLSELGRCWAELTRVRVGHLSRGELEALDREYLKSIAPPPALAKKEETERKEEKAEEQPKLSKEEELVRDRWARLTEMVRKGRLDSTRTFLDKYGADLGLSPSPSAGKEEGVWGVLPEWMGEARTTPTLLHLAAAAGQPALVRLFLDPPYNASPYPYPPSPPPPPSSSSSSSTAQSRAAYDLSPSRQTRNEFRFAYHREPEKWDWSGLGRVPGGLDESVEREKERREEEKRSKLRAREKEREEQERKREEEERRADEGMREKARELAASSAGGSGPKRLGGGPPMPVRERERAGLSEEQKTRVMREERARAAEARLKRVGG